MYLFVHNDLFTHVQLHFRVITVHIVLLLLLLCDVLRPKKLQKSSAVKYMSITR